MGPGIRRWNFKIREQFWYKLLPYLFKLLPYLLVNPTVKISLLPKEPSACEGIYSSLPPYTRKGQHAATRCNTLQHTAPGHLYVVATLYSKRSATHCNTLQHAAIRYTRVSIRRCHNKLEKVCCMSSGLVYSSLQCVAVCLAVATMRILKKRLVSYRVHATESSHRWVDSFSVCCSVLQCVLQLQWWKDSRRGFFRTIKPYLWFSELIWIQEISVLLNTI